MNERAEEKIDAEESQEAQNGEAAVSELDELRAKADENWKRIGHTP